MRFPTQTKKCKIVGPRGNTACTAGRVRNHVYLLASGGKTSATLMSQKMASVGAAKLWMTNPTMNP